MMAPAFPLLLPSTSKKTKKKKKKTQQKKSKKKKKKNRKKNRKKTDNSELWQLTAMYVDTSPLHCYLRDCFLT